jgi:hypothetical protein
MQYAGEHQTPRERKERKMMMRNGAMELQIHYIVCCLGEKALQNLVFDLKINAVQSDRNLSKFIRNMPSTSSTLKMEAVCSSET